MNQQEVKQVLSDIKQQFRSAQVEVDDAYVRADSAAGYQVRVIWAGRTAKIGKFSQWKGLKQAWQVLKESR